MKDLYNRRTDKLVTGFVWTGGILAFLIWLALVTGIIVVALHFIIKYW